MDNQSCPRCAAQTANQILYQCVRCFTIYCTQCDDTKEGHLCPKCGMSQRMVLSSGK